MWALLDLNGALEGICFDGRARAQPRALDACLDLSHVQAELLCAAERVGTCRALAGIAKRQVIDLESRLTDGLRRDHGELHALRGSALR